VDEYREKVFNTALSMVQDHGMAEDLAQEVFVTVYKSILGFNESSSLSTWIYRITVNKCLDHLRARNRQKNRGFLSMLFSQESGEPLHDKADFEHPGIRLEQKEKSQYLFSAIASLSENQKTVFVLANIEDLPQKEIAEIMNMSVKGVESLLQRAKANLRKKLSAVYDRRNKDQSSSK
jgi:RNA polymerase sigma factor (sigma-70 family)